MLCSMLLMSTETELWTTRSSLPSCAPLLPPSSASLGLSTRALMMSELLSKGKIVVLYAHLQSIIAHPQIGLMLMVMALYQEMNLQQH